MTATLDSRINASNLASYSDPAVVQAYSQQMHLFPAESFILEELQHDIRDQPVLDIGIGGGRTIMPLRRLTRHYVGIDYAAPMVEAAKVDYPGADLRTMDARDLSAFADGSFGFVLFSFNGIDYVTHEGRMQVLSEVLRVLRPGGWFAFSSHNRAAHGRGENPSPGTAQQKRAQSVERRSPMRLLRGAANRLVNEVVGQYHHAINRRLEVNVAEYSIVNEPAHLYALLTYYIDIPEQVCQLNRAGFTGDKVRAFDSNGSLVTEDKVSPWITYLARKPEL